MNSQVSGQCSYTILSCLADVRLKLDFEHIIIERANPICTLKFLFLYYWTQSLWFSVLFIFYTYILSFHSPSY